MTKPFHVEDKKAVFIHIPRTGGSSIKGTCNRELLHKTVLYNKLGHRTATEMIRDVEGFSSVFSFCFIRNPWERLASWWGLSSKYYQTYQTFEEFLSQTIKNANPMHEFIYSDSGERLVTYVGRFENLIHDWNNVVCILLGKNTHIELAHLNGYGEGKNYRKWFTKETLEMVEPFVRKDAEIFGYEY